jgi:hypothetical protein
MAKIIPNLEQDGLRVNEEVSQDEVNIMLKLFVGGEVQVDHRLRSFEVSHTDPAAAVPAVCRYAKMAAAIARFLNEGGDLHEVYGVFDILQSLNIHPEVTMDLVCIEVEETHVRTYCKDDGNFVRIIEDEVAEEFTSEEMLTLAADNTSEDLIL